MTRFALSIVAGLITVTPALAQERTPLEWSLSCTTSYASMHELANRDGNRVAAEEYGAKALLMAGVARDMGASEQTVQGRLRNTLTGLGARASHRLVLDFCDQWIARSL